MASKSALVQQEETTGGSCEVCSPVQTVPQMDTRTAEVVEVVWEDSSSHYGVVDRMAWLTVPEALGIVQGDDLHIVSVGYVLEDTPDYLALFQSLTTGDPQMVNEILQIPKSAIRSKRTI